MKNLNRTALIGTAILGFLILLFPAFWIKLVVFAVGLGAIAYGVYNLIFTRHVFQDPVYENVILVKSVFSIVVGVISVLFPLAVASTMWNTMVYVLVVYLLLDAVIGFYSVSLLKTANIDRRKYILENFCLVVVAVVLIVISPGRLGLFVIRLVGFILLAGSVLTLALTVLLKKNITDAEVVEVKDAEEIPDSDD